MKKAAIAASILVLGLEGAAFVPLSVIAAPTQSGTLLAQATQQPLPPASQSVRTPETQLGFGLADGTPVKLKLKQTLSSSTSHSNDPIEFEVADDVRVGNTVVIARGATARGMVVEARPSGMLGRKGKLEIAVKEVDLTSGERVLLRANQATGGGHAGGLLAAAAIVNPLFLLFKGKTVTYKAGTEMNAFVDGNFQLNRNRFTSR